MMLMTEVLSVCPFYHAQFVGIFSQFVSLRKQDGLCGSRCHVLTNNVERQKKGNFSLSVSFYKDGKKFCARNFLADFP